MTSRDQGISSELSNKTIQINEKSIMVSIQNTSQIKNSNNKDREKNTAMETK